MSFWKTIFPHRHNIINMASGAIIGIAWVSQIAPNSTLLQYEDYITTALALSTIGIYNHFKNVV